MKNLLFKLKKYWLVILLVLIVLLGACFAWSKQNGNGHETIIVKKGDFIQAVAVAGKVIPAKTVELGFNRGGKIISVPVSVGTRVGASQNLAELDSREALLALENAKLELKKLKENSAASGSNSLTKDYEEALSNIDNTYLEIADIYESMNRILTDHRVSTYKTNLPNDTARSYYNSSTASFYKAQNFYNDSYADYKKIQKPLNKEQIVDLLEETYKLAQLLSQALKEMDNYVSYVYNYTDIASRPQDVVTDKASVKDWRETVNGLISDLDDSRNTIKDTVFSLQAQNLEVQQRQYTYDDSFLSAPFSGVVTKLDFKVGQIVSAGQIGLSLESEGLFQIESYVPEINIAKIKVGNQARVTLDAYGEETIFDARIIEVDPAETIKDGVSTYRIKLQFAKVDSRIKSGMTANLLLTTEQKSDVISLPSGSILNIKEKRYVQIKTEEGLREQEVTLGSIGALGETEILSGLMGGEVVVLKPTALE